MKMEAFVDMEFKDDSPCNTVEKIRNILKNNGLEAEELWVETKVPYCYALRLRIKELNYSTAGKGLSRELALASAYGEMMERLQLGFLGKLSSQKDGSFSLNDAQDISVSLEQLLEESGYLQKVSDRLLGWNGKKISGKEILCQYADEEGQIRVTPFVNLTDGKVVYFPSELRKAMYSANGCAAGNSVSEAIVQGLSEIVERFYRLRIIRESICVPDVPEEVLKQYETPYRIVTYIRDHGYKVWVKDCSLGDRFPVLCVVYVDRATGKYHTHFGAAPIFEIALTRALTETFQGRNIDSFANYSDFFYSKDEKEFASNLNSELIYGTSKRLPDFFVGSTKVPYNPCMGLKGSGNRELLKECVRFFKEQGYDIFVRNSSGLGFPTVQIIIPGYSETHIYRLSKSADENRYLPYAVKTLRDPSKASRDEIMGFLLHNSEMKAFAGHRNRSSFLANIKLMMELSLEQETFFFSASLAHVQFALGNYENAAKYVGSMLNCRIGFKDDLLVCLKRYLDLTLNGHECDKVNELLSLFHSDETLKIFYSYIDNKKNPLDEFVLHCDLECRDSCVLKQFCFQRKTQELIDLVNRKTAQLNFDTFCGDIRNLIAQ